MGNITVQQLYTFDIALSLIIVTFAMLELLANIKRCVYKSKVQLRKRDCIYVRNLLFPSQECPSKYTSAVPYNQWHSFR